MQPVSDWHCQLPSSLISPLYLVSQGLEHSVMRLTSWWLGCGDKKNWVRRSWASFLKVFGESTLNVCQHSKAEVNILKSGSTSCCTLNMTPCIQHAAFRASVTTLHNYTICSLMLGVALFRDDTIVTMSLIPQAKKFPFPFFFLTFITEPLCLRRSQKDHSEWMSIKGVERAEGKVRRRTETKITNQIKQSLSPTVSMGLISPVLHSLFSVCELGIACFDKSCVQIIGNNKLFLIKELFVQKWIFPLCHRPLLLPKTKQWAIHT